MPFNGAGSTISSATDVFMSSQTNGDMLKFNSATSKWNNTTPVGTVAMATSGGLETVSTANATGTTTLNLVNGNVFNMTLTGTTIFVFSGATNGRACSFSLYLRQDATGGRTLTWPASVRWSGGAPTLTTTANATDILVFETLNGGTTWFGSLVGLNFT